MSEIRDAVRQTILSRLEENHARSKQMEVFFGNYSKLANQLKTRKANQKKVERSESSESTAEVEKVRQEISDLYRLKSINDQNLIDANAKLVTYSAKLLEVKADKAAIEENYQKLSVKFSKLDDMVKKLRQDNTNIDDERLALSTTCRMLEQQKIELNVERERLLNKITELNQQTIERMNAEVDLEEQRRSLRMQEQIASAMRETPLDRKVSAMIRDTQSMKIGSYSAGDIVPSIQIAEMHCDDGEVNAVRWFGENIFATGGTDRIVKLWRFNNNKAPTKINTFAGSNGAITQIDHDPDRKYLLASSNDNNIRLWNTDTSRMICTLSGHTEQVLSCKFYQTSSAISGSADRIIKIWDLAAKRCIRSLFPASRVCDVIGKVPLNPALIISGHLDRKVRFWDGRTSEPVKEMSFVGKICSLDISENGLEVLCASRDETLKLLDIRNFSVLHTYHSEQFRTSCDTARCVISPGGSYVAAGSANGSVYVWNKHNTCLEKRLVPRNENPILSLSWNPTGNGILAATKQKMVTCWQ